MELGILFASHADHLTVPCYGRDKAMRSPRLFAEQVMPEFRR